MAQGSKECTACGQPLPMGHQGPCPNCGSERHRIVVPLGLAAEANAAAHVTWEKTSIRNYYEMHPTTLVLLVVLTLAASLVGLFLTGTVGVIVALLLGALGLAIRPQAITKVRHERIERGG